MLAMTRKDPVNEMTLMDWFEIFPLPAEAFPHTITAVTQLSLAFQQSSREKSITNITHVPKLIYGNVGKAT